MSGSSRRTTAASARRPARFTFKPSVTAARRDTRRVDLIRLVNKFFYSERAGDVANLTVTLATAGNSDIEELHVHTRVPKPDTLGAFAREWSNRGTDDDDDNSSVDGHFVLPESVSSSSSSSSSSDDENSDA